MAPKPNVLASLWGLTLFFHGAMCLCNVTCWTDYDVLLNCSCSAPVPTHPLQIEVTCRDSESVVTGSCEVKPHQSWCTIEKELENVASTDTKCTTEVKQDDEGIIKVIDTSTWQLSDEVKPQPPFSVCVANVDGFYNITWDASNALGCLSYKVHIWSNDLSKDQAHSFEVKDKFILLKHKMLQPHVNYIVAVQAKTCPEDCYKGPWSEWSSSAEWTAETEGMNPSWWYVSLPIILVLGLLLLGYLQKPFWQKKIQVITNVPKPNDFFKPLYHSYGGNFKEWVKPVFSEYDYARINSLAPMMSEKQHNILHWNNEKQSDTKEQQFLHMLQPHASLAPPPQDAGSSQGHSTGHISIHTVTLSGEEMDAEALLQGSVNPLRSYQEGESFGSYAEADGEHAGYNAGEQQLSPMNLLPGGLQRNHIANHLSLENINFEPHAHFLEPERVSLDSFASNEQSEDGYPHVDLDTIDSGFAECGSPGVSPSSTAEQIDSDLFHENKNSNSNYVKQWMICSTIQEDSSSESELHQTQ